MGHMVRLFAEDSESLVNTFGHQLSASVIIKCEKFVWKEKFDKDTREINGLIRFIRCYEVKLNNLLQFDYYAKDMFLVKIFRDNEVECNNRIEDPELFLKNENLSSWRKDRYTIDRNSVKTMKYQKSHALWSFNANENYDYCFDINIDNVDLDHNIRNLVRKLSDLSYL